MKHLPFLFILLIANYCTAQTWQWVATGGSSANSTTDNHPEQIIDMAVDRNGNVYTISNVDTTDLNINGIPQKGWFPPKDIMITSFTCNGILRWSKIIGGLGLHQPIALRTDSLDGVYAIIDLSKSTADSTFIANDTVLVGKNHKSAFLIKYDTSGNFKWLADPEPVSTNLFTRAVQFDIYVEGNGTVFWLCYLHPGTYAGTFNAISAGHYIMIYDKGGAFQNVITPDMPAPQHSSAHTRMQRNKDGDFILSGKQPFKMYVGNDSITNDMFVVAFDKNGNYLWKRENTVANLESGFVGRPAIDPDGGIYLTGYSMAGDKFGGYTIVNSNSERTPFVVKLDKSGKTVWANNARASYISEGRALALRSSGELDLLVFSDHIKWPGFYDSIVSKTSIPVLTRFNTQTGKILGIDSIGMISSLLPNPWVVSGIATSVVADGRNNIFVGGGFYDTLNVAGSVIKSTGGLDDFFITRYGYDTCKCSDIPDPTFTAINTSGNTFNFTYTGSTPYTSILWDFGDSNTSTQANPTHTFSKDGKYPVTVTVTNDCGDNTYGSNQVALKVGITAKADIRIYPNPAKDLVQIEGANPVSVQLQNIQGQLVKSFSGDLKRLDVAGLPGGIYLLRVQAKEGVFVHKLVKE